MVEIREGRKSGSHSGSAPRGGGSDPWTPNSQLGLDDFLEHFYATLRRMLKDAENGLVAFMSPAIRSVGAFRTFVSTVTEAHVFYLGDEEQLRASARKIGEDVVAESGTGIVMPFENVGMISRSVAHGWTFDWLERIEGARRVFGNKDVFGYVTIGEGHLAREEMPAPLFFTIECYGEGVPLRIEFHNIWFEGPNASTATAPPPPPEDLETNLRIVSEVLFECCAISHPSLYVVRSTPIRSPREERQAKKNGRPPDRTRPRYIVVDHTGLDELRSRRAAATHASPIPHERRGHWRQLAESCVKARAEGRTRVWVRPAVVGDLEFSDERSRYKVILDPRNLSQTAGSREG